ncbi:Replication factor C large subunit [Candidatus Burarchaeum australiense]|nr:Replication factor C large subunit [Candidatus Burarchaeum australiense]
MLWNKRYAPAKLHDVIGNASAVANVLSWAKGWEAGRRSPPLILHGPSGIGKSAIPHALAEEFGWSLLEVNASDLRNKAAIARVTGHAATSSTLSGARRLVFVDDVDSMFAADRGGLPELIRIIEQSSQPILMTASDLWSPKISLLRKSCKGVGFGPVPVIDIVVLLKKIAKSEHSEVPDKVLSAIAESSNGDVRSAINDLQSFAEGKGTEFLPQTRNTLVDVKRALSDMFGSASFKDARRSVFDVDVDHDMLLKWIDENIPAHCSSRLALAKAFDALSRASLFDARAQKRQNYSLWRYSSDLASGGVVVAGARSTSASGAHSSHATGAHSSSGPVPAGSHPVQMAFPRQILLLSRNKIERARLGALASKLAVHCHVSKKRAAAYFPLVAALSAGKEGRTLLKESMDLSDDDLAVLDSLAA